MILCLPKHRSSAYHATVSSVEESLKIRPDGAIRILGILSKQDEVEESEC